MTAPYAELQVTSHYSFLRGASHIEELFATAKALGCEALGITDHATFAGVARAHQRATEAGVRLVVGCRLALDDGTELLAYPTDCRAWSRLCRLLTLGKARTGKGGCRIGGDDFASYADGVLAVLLPDGAEQDPIQLARLRALMGNRAYLALTPRRLPGDAVRLEKIYPAWPAMPVWRR